MDAAADTLTVLERIQDNSAELMAELFERLEVEERELAPTVDAQWVRRHAHLTLPKHTLSTRLQGLKLAAHLRHQMVQAFECEIRGLHLSSSSALSRACHDLRASPIASFAAVSQQNADNLAKSMQMMLEQKVQVMEDKWVALCAKRCHQSLAHFHVTRTDGDPGVVVVKGENISDDELLDVEADPKQYHNMLEYIFRRGIEKPAKADKMAFATKTGLSYRTITVWFQNRRSRGALGGRCGWREKRRMRSLGMTDDQILLLDDLNGLEPISSSSAEEPLESEIDPAGSETDVGELNQGSTPEARAPSDPSETEVEFDESEWETDPEDTPDTSTPFRGIHRVPSLTRSVSTTSSASVQLHHSASNSDIDVESRASSPTPDVLRIPPPAFNYRAARQLRSPSPAPSIHSTSPLLDDDAKLPPLDTPQLHVPFRLGSWRTNPSGSSLSQTLVTMQVPQIQLHAPSLSPSPASDGEDHVLNAPSPAESENDPVTPPTITGFTFPSLYSSQLTNTQTQTPKQFVFGPNTPSEALSSKPSTSQFTFGLPQMPPSSPKTPAPSFVLNPHQTSSSPTRVEPSTPLAPGQRQSAAASTASVTPKFTFGSASPCSPSHTTSFKFVTVHGPQVGTSIPKSNFSVSSPQVATSHKSYVRSPSGGLDNYSTPYMGGRQSSPTIVAPQFRVPSPGSFDFSNPRPPSPKSDSSARKFTVPSVFTFGMPPPASAVMQSAQAPRKKLVSASQKASPVLFTFGNEDPRQSSTTFAFGDNTPKSAAAIELVPDRNTLPISSQLRLLSSPTPIDHTSSLPASTSFSTPILPTPRNPVAFSSKAQAAISQPTAAVKGKAALVPKPRKPSVLQRHAAAAESLSFVSSSRHPSPSSSKDKGKGKMPAHDFFTAASTNRSTDEISQLDILADAALASTEQDGDDTDLEIATSAPLPLLNEYNDSDADSDGHEGDDEDEPLMGNVLPPVRAIPPTAISTSPPSSAFSFSLPAPTSLAAPRLPKSIITEDIRQRVTSFTQNYLTPGVPQRPTVTLAGRG